MILEPKHKNFKAGLWIRIRPDPKLFACSDPDPKLRQKPDPDPKKIISDTQTCFKDKYKIKE
jgi:hypothetical protein